jgi:hypothetical protein
MARSLPGSQRYRPYLDLEKPILEPAARCDRLRTAGTIKIGTNLLSTALIDTVVGGTIANRVVG